MGFDLYMDMLENAVKFLKEGREPDENALVSEHAEVDIGFPALIPESYVNDVSTRLPTPSSPSSATASGKYPRR